MSKYDKLFEPIQIGTTEIKNRLFMAPMNLQYNTHDHMVSDQEVAWYNARAAGGYGLIITGAIMSNSKGWSGHTIHQNAECTNLNQARLVNVMARNVQAFGAKLFVQLSPGFGRQGGTNIYTGERAAGPSAVPMAGKPEDITPSIIKLFSKKIPDIGKLYDPQAMAEMSEEERMALIEDTEKKIKLFYPGQYKYLKGEAPRALEHWEIVWMEDQFADCAAMAYALGVDGIEVHSPHGYLIHTFFSERTNQRKDEYGGNLENRARFFLNIIRKTRKLVGRDPVLGCRLSAADRVPGGATKEDMKKIAQWGVSEGLDFVDISDGHMEVSKWMAPADEGAFLKEGAALFREADLGVPLLTPNIHTPELALSALEEGKTDMVGMGRQSIADPDWPNKVQAGRLDDIVKCTKCWTCGLGVFECSWSKCAVNPVAGFERFMPEYWIVNAPKVKKKVDKYLNKRGW